MPEKDNQSTTFETLKLAAANAFNRLPTAKLKKGMAIAGSVIAMAGMQLEAELVFPATAQAEQHCTTESTTTTTTNSDGSITTTTTESTHCTDSSDSPDGSQPPSQQPSKQHPDNTPKHHKPHKNKPIHGPKDDKTDSQKNFPGYGMEDSSFTDHNGCFITGAASALRRETGDAHITPKKIFYPALRRMWTPSTGVKGGLLFNALPSMASHFDVKVYKTDFQGAVKAIKNDDEVMMLAATGHFTDGGHYMDAWKIAGHNRLVIDDPNGKGKYGDSERASGWSAAELQRAGIIGYRVLHLKQR